MTRLLMFAALMVACAADQQLNCDLGNAAELNRCLKTLLENSRDRIQREVDPLRYNRENDGARIDVRVNGLSEYVVEHLDVSFQQNQIALSARIAWPGINANGDIKVTSCARFLFGVIKHCSTLCAQPHITVDRSVGTLTASLTVGVNSNHKLSVIPSNINVDLSLSKIKVKANLRGFLGFVNRLIGDKASRKGTELANEWWKGPGRGFVEREAEEALARAVRKEIAPRLANLLKV